MIELEMMDKTAAEIYEEYYNKEYSKGHDRKISETVAAFSTQIYFQTITDILIGKLTIKRDEKKSEVYQAAFEEFSKGALTEYDYYKSEALIYFLADIYAGKYEKLVNSGSIYANVKEYLYEYISGFSYGFVSGYAGKRVEKLKNIMDDPTAESVKDCTP